MRLESFWRWYDRAARVDFGTNILGYMVDWRALLWLLVPSGSVMTVFWGAIENLSPLYVWVTAVVVTAALFAAIHFGLLLLDRIRTRQRVVLETVSAGRVDAAPRAGLALTNQVLVSAVIGGAIAGWVVWKIAQPTEWRVTNSQNECLRKTIQARSERPQFTIRPVIGSPGAARFGSDLYTIFGQSGWPVGYTTLDHEYGLNEKGLRLAVSRTTDRTQLNPKANAIKSVLDACGLTPIPGAHSAFPDGEAAIIVGNGPS